MRAAPMAIVMACIVGCTDQGNSTAAGARNAGQQASVDQATVDDGAFRNPVASQPITAVVETTLPSGAVVLATPTAVEVKNYLASDEAAGKRFTLPFVRFVKGMEVREDPNGSLATLAAVLNAHPNARVRVEVVHSNPGQPRPSQDSSNRARAVAQVLVRNGVGADRVTSAGVKGDAIDAPLVQLLVTQK